jgi:hypothetical protein
MSAVTHAQLALTQTRLQLRRSQLPFALAGKFLSPRARNAGTRRCAGHAPDCRERCEPATFACRTWDTMDKRLPLANSQYRQPFFSPHAINFAVRG